MEPLLVFENFGLENLDRSWIKQVWESAFTSFENVPNDYPVFLEIQDTMELLKETGDVVKNWIAQNSVTDDSGLSEMAEATEEVSWQTLVALNLDVQGLLAVLARLIKMGQDFRSDQDARQLCLKATGLYFVLLSIPGSNAFQAFHSGLYELALKTLTLSRRLTPDHKKSRQALNFDEIEYDSAEEEDEESYSSLSKTQCATLTKGLNGVVYDLITMLNSASASLGIRSLETTVFYLVEMTKLAVETISDFSRVKNCSAEASPSSLAYNAYVALRLICNPKYATIPIITRTIGKYVLPQLVITVNGQSSPKQMAVVRDSTIHFFKTLFEKHGRDAQEALITLIQHLMINPPDRLENRQKQAVVVIKLMNLCRSSGSAYERCLKDLIKFSHHNKISCRIFAQDIIGKFLIDLATSQINRKDEKNRWPRIRSKKLLLAAALSRCVDSSSMVRGRAIATFAEYTDSIDDPEVREIFSVVEERESTEMPSLDDLLEAIANNDANDILPNSEGIIAMLKRRSEDERALIRRSSIQALRNGVIVIPELLNEASPILRSRCRDAVLTVRRYAIRALTTLLEKYPENSKLCEDWVDSVIPRIFDAETKVQEEVLDSMEKLTIRKITEMGRNSDDSDNADLPWKILNELSTNKMADHLAKACGTWVDCGIVTNVTLTIVKSHVGTKNNVGAWFLLASIAEHRSLGNMTDYYDWYVKALNANAEEDGFTSSLVVQVLRHCWPSFDDRSLRRIHEDLVVCLRNYRVRVYLISHCLDIVHGIENFRTLEAPSGSQDEAATVRQLVGLSEATIARLVEPNDKTDKSDKDDDPGTLLFRATCTLGHASFLCSEKISLSSLRVLQGFLLDWNGLPKKLRAKTELQGAAITVLGQQSVRDRDVAQEMTPLFGRLLAGTRDNAKNANMANGPAVRINAAKAMADICVRFTALVEPHLPDMCVSMKDENIEVRQVILVIFIQLLAEDFIKINGPFFFHIMSMLTDVDSTIRRMTIFLVKERLLSKNKFLVTQQFVNCIMHFNDYDGRTIGNRQRVMKYENREKLTLVGEKRAKERRVIYDFMLEHLDAPGKLTILVSLTRRIIRSECGKIGSGNRELDVTTEKGICVFKDAMYVLSSDHLQPNSCARQTTDDDLPDEVAATTTTTTTTAANSVIVEAMKRHRLQIFLPGLVELKKRLTIAKSNLVVDVATLISRMLNEYTKDQLDDLYNEYPNLEKEIERDIRKRERRDGVPVNEGKNGNCPSSPSKKSRVDTSLLVDPNWMPRIVLRRLSSLTYPRISELQTRKSSIGSRNPEITSIPSTSGRSSPRKHGFDVAKRQINHREKRSE